MAGGVGIFRRENRLSQISLGRKIGLSFGEIFSVLNCECWVDDNGEEEGSCWKKERLPEADE